MKLHPSSGFSKHQVRQDGLPGDTLFGTESSSIARYAMVSTPSMRKHAGRFLLYDPGVKISALVGMWLCVAFALLCLGVAYTGFSALATLTDPEQRELSVGYAWFWTFLGSVATVFGVLSWMIKEGKFGEQP